MYATAGVKKQTATVLIASFVTATFTVLLSNAERSINNLSRNKDNSKSSCSSVELFWWIELCPPLFGGQNYTRSMAV